MESLIVWCSCCMQIAQGCSWIMWMQLLPGHIFASNCLLLPELKIIVSWFHLRAFADFADFKWMQKLLQQVRWFSAVLVSCVNAQKCMYISNSYHQFIMSSSYANHSEIFKYACLDLYVMRRGCYKYPYVVDIQRSMSTKGYRILSKLFRQREQKSLQSSQIQY